MPAILVGVSLGSGLVSVLTALHSTSVAVAVGSASLIVAALLVALTCKVWGRARQEWQRVAAEHRELVALDDHSQWIQARLKHDRESALAAPATSAPALRPDRELPGPRPGSLSYIALEEVRQRHVAGEEPRAEDLAGILRAAADARAHRVTQLGDLAFAIAFLGNVLGLAIQIYIAQEVMGPEGGGTRSLLAGGLLATTKTFAGGLIAVYARAIGSRILGTLEGVAADVRRWLSFNVLPRCDAHTRAVLDLQVTLDESVRAFAAALDKMRSCLDQEFQRGAAAAVETVRAFTAGELTDTLRAKVKEPFHAEMAALRTGIESAGQAIGQATAGLGKVTQQFIADLRTTTRTPDRLVQNLRECSAVLDAVSGRFERVVAEVRALEDSLRSISAQADLSLANLLAAEAQRASSSNGKGDDVGGAAIAELAEELRASAIQLNEAMRHLVTEFRAPRVRQETRR